MTFPFSIYSFTERMTYVQFLVKFSFTPMLRFHIFSQQLDTAHCIQGINHHASAKFYQPHWEIQLIIILWTTETSTQLSAWIRDYTYVITYTPRAL